MRHDAAEGDLAEVRPLAVSKSEYTILRSLSTSEYSLCRSNRELVKGCVDLLALRTVLREKSLHVRSGAIDVELARKCLAGLVLGFANVSGLRKDIIMYFETYA